MKKHIKSGFDVLLVDDDREILDALRQSLEIADKSVVTAASFIEAIDYITPNFEGVIVSDVRMPGRDGFHLMSEAHRIDPELPVIMLTGEGDIPTAVRAMAEEAYDFLEKPCPPKKLLEVVERSLQARKLVCENRALKEQLSQNAVMSNLLIGNSTLVTELRQKILRLADKPVEVLIEGETGTGKELVAKMLHSSSGRDGAFIVVNCASQTQESLLGAGGAFDQAKGGTILLDEVSTLPLPLQAALMHMRPETPDETAPRILATLQNAPEEVVQSGQMRADLFYRLDVVRLRVPPLKSRKEDIPLLYKFFADQASQRFDRAAPPLNQHHIESLLSREWPGNCRELRNHAERWVLGFGDVETEQSLSLSERLERIEQAILEQNLKEQKGQIVKVCEVLKLPRKTLYDRLAKYGIKPDEYRDSS